MNSFGTAVEGCPFCEKAQSSTVPVMVFEPLNPVTPGHMLVVPAIHVADAAKNPTITALVMRRAAQVAAGVGPCNIITSLGADASQTVFHLHVHVVPRRPGDGLLLPWSKPDGWTAEQHRKDAGLVQNAMQRVAEQRVTTGSVYVPIDDASDVLMALHRAGLYRPEPIVEGGTEVSVGTEQHVHDPVTAIGMTNIKAFCLTCGFFPLPLKGSRPIIFTGIRTAVEADREPAPVKASPIADLLADLEVGPDPVYWNGFRDGKAAALRDAESPVPPEPLDGEAADVWRSLREELHRRYLAARTADDKERIWQEILLNDKGGLQPRRTR